MSAVDEIGAGTAARPPGRAAGDAQPGDVYRYGPHFVDFVTDRFASVERALATLLAERERRLEREGFRKVVGGNTDGSGNATVTVFELAPNQKFALHRLVVEAAGYTFASPFNGAGAYLEVIVNGAVWDGVSLVAAAAGGSSLPCVFTASRLQAVEAQDGETLAVKVFSGPASTQLSVRALGVLTTVFGDDR